MRAADSNLPPNVAGGWIELEQNQPYAISLSDIGYSDADGDPLQWLTIQSLPTSGTLEYYGYPIYSGQTLDYYEIAYGYLTYHPDPYANSSHYDSFSFIANDGKDNKRLSRMPHG